MSTDPGKIEIQGVEEFAGEKVFVLRFLQARNPDWVHRPFLARFDPEARWLDDLEPATIDASARRDRGRGRARFFWEDELAAMRARGRTQVKNRDPEVLDK